MNRRQCMLVLLLVLVAALASWVVSSGFRNGVSAQAQGPTGSTRSTLQDDPVQAVKNDGRNQVPGEGEGAGEGEFETPCVSLQDPQVTITLDPAIVSTGENVGVTLSVTDDSAVLIVSDLTIGTGPNAIVVSSNDLQLTGLGTPAVGGFVAFLADLAPGTYEVALTATDNCGREGAGSALLTVEQPVTPTPTESSETEESEGTSEHETPGGGSPSIPEGSANTCLGVRLTASTALASKMSWIREWRDHESLSTVLGEIIVKGYYRNLAGIWN